MAGYRGVGGGDRFYPDALTAEPVAPVADQAFQNMVWVDVHVNPQLANPDEKIQVHLKWIDMDDPFHHGDVVDPNDGIYYKAETFDDNRTDAALVGLDTATTHPKLGGVRKLVVETDPQGNASVIFRAGQHPGDNYRIVATGRNLEVDLWKAFSSDDFADLFMDLDGDGVWDDATEPALMGPDQDPLPPVATGGARATPRLTIWRHLYYELDSMGPIFDNDVIGTTGTVQNNTPVQGQSTVPLNVDPDSPQALAPAHRFDGGFLAVNGVVFTVVSSGTDHVIVQNGPQGQIPASNSEFDLHDDDSLTLETNVPEPNTGLLNLFEMVFITPVPLGPGPRTDIASAVNVENVEDDFRELVELQKDFPTSRQHWTAYVMGAFQGAKDFDHDPGTEIPSQQGTSWSGIGSMIFLETIPDRARTGIAAGENWDAVILERQTLVHEIGHQFEKLIGWEDTIGIMRSKPPADPGLTGNPDDNFFSEEAQLKIRESTTVNEKVNQ